MLEKKLTSLLLIFLFVSPSWGDSPLSIRIPAQSRLVVSGTDFELQPKNGQLFLWFPQGPSFPFNLTVVGPLGGEVTKIISSWSDMKPLVIRTGIVASDDPNPQTLSLLPSLCPRVTLTETKQERKGEVISVYEAFYHGERDRLNHIPTFQLLEPDSRGGRLLYQSYSKMDGKNVLLLKEAGLTYDYEDSQIIDYQGPDPLTGKEVTIHEGNGGFYANIHYAILPYDKKWKKLDSQTLLHVAQGKLGEIDRQDLAPSLKTHSLIPGPFLSRSGHAYEMCEWGDTAYQAPHQRLAYDNIALWDWDCPVRNADHILLIVWEGDEEDWMIQQKLIDPFYLTDDLIGVFEIKKEETRKILTLVNRDGNFKMSVQTGDLAEGLRDEE